MTCDFYADGRQEKEDNFQDVTKNEYILINF